MNNEKTPTLSIKDIVLLKERPQDYIKIYAERLTKTHDGTSSGPIKNKLKTHINNTVGSYYRHTTVFSEDGKSLWTPYDSEVYDWEYLMVTSEDHEEPVFEETEAFVDDLNEHANMHIVTKPSYDDDYHGGEGGVANLTFVDKNGDSYRLVSDEEAGRLLMKNTDGEYMFRSTTIIGDDGTSTTLIKNNKFDEGNHEKLQETIDNMNSDVFKQQLKLNDRSNEILREKMSEYRKKNPDHYMELEELKEWNEKRYNYEQIAKKQAIQQAVEELGNPKDIITDKYAPILENECNVKIKVNAQKDCKTLEEEKDKHWEIKYSPAYISDKVEYENDWHNKYVDYPDDYEY